jgi:Helix-turn-helix domain
MPAELALANAILDALRPEIISIVHAELEKAAVITSDELWLTERDVAARFRIPVRTLQHWRCIGRKGPSFHKHGRAVRYRLSDVEAWNVDRT